MPYLFFLLLIGNILLNEGKKPHKALRTSLLRLHRAVVSFWELPVVLVKANGGTFKEEVWNADGTSLCHGGTSWSARYVD